ncbi:pentapeptide repeat-containing protein [Streptomyces sp. NPDC001401]|uniref:pentapeptide repeat-containing protein n=1 Tax=Streptomyces sp. NPDC001401 TaxID=3364570 RepID=UPI0036CBED1C
MGSRQQGQRRRATERFSCNTMPAADRGADGQATSWWTRLERSVGLLVSMATLAVAAFTWISIKQVNSEQSITREGQITDRYNVAVQNLGNSSQDVRLGGVYALQRIMQDSSRDQPTIVDVLAAYVRAHAAKSPDKASPDGGPNQVMHTPASDVEAALSVLRDRESRHDGSAQLDLSGRALNDTDLHGADFHGADLQDADLRGMNLRGTDLHAANLFGAELSGSLLNQKLRGADFHDAILNVADLYYSDLVGVNMRGAKLGGATLTHSWLLRTDLGGATLRGADLGGSSLRKANLAGADLEGATLAGVDFTGANLAHADLRGADLKADDDWDDAVVSVQQLLSAKLDKATKLPATLAKDPRIRKAIASPGEG